MVQALISGTVMELLAERDFETKKELATVTAVVYQKGNKNLISVKKVPPGKLSEGETDVTIPAVIRMYTMDSGSGMSVSYAGEINF